MRRALLPMLLITLLAGCASQGRGGISGPGPIGAPPWARDPDNVTQPQAQSLEQMLELDDFDLPRALLLFSREHAPEFAKGDAPPLDVDAVLARYDSYLVDLERRIKRDRTPRQQLLTLIEFVHDRLGLRFDPQDPNGHDPQNLFFDSVINRRLGYCVTLSLAYVVFGQAVGLQVAGVRLPGHFVVQFIGGEGAERYEALVESTTGGGQLDVLDVWARHRFSKQAVEAGTFLTALTDKQVFSTLYNNLAGLTHLRGDDELAIKRYSRAIELAPNNTEALYNRALLARKGGRPQPALRDLNEALRLDPNFTLALIARAGLLWEAGEKSPARDDLALATRQRSEWAEPHMLEGMFAASEGELEPAIEAFKRALERDASSADAHAALARIYRLKGETKLAQDHEKAAEELSK